MNETDSLTCVTVIGGESSEPVVYLPEVDPAEGMTPELKAKLIAMNERLRPKPPDVPPLKK